MVGFPLHCFPIILFSWHLDLIVWAPPATKLPYKDIRENWVQSLSRGEGKSGRENAAATPFPSAARKSPHQRHICQGYEGPDQRLIIRCIRKHGRAALGRQPHSGATLGLNGSPLRWPVFHRLVCLDDPRSISSTTCFTSSGALWRILHECGRVLRGVWVLYCHTEGHFQGGCK